MKSSQQKARETSVSKPASVVRPVKLKRGGRVRVTRGGYVLGIGRYSKATKRKNGEWHLVNMAAPGDTPDVRMYRRSNLTILN